MSILPPPPKPFGGTIRALATESTPERPAIPPTRPAAPNVVVVMLDDVGFGAPGSFGGPIPTPALDRIAANGVRYNQFHTTAMCSPTRAALLTGHNHHSAHMGAISEIAYGFPGYDGIIPQSTACVAEILRQNGYGTALFGKVHVTPMWELGPSGPFDRWPTGLGFDRFYGFLGAESSQWEPAVYDQTTPVAPYLGRDDYHLTEDLADKAIDWMRLQKTSAPDKPFFVYFSPGATHAPHHVWPEWSDRFRGQFDGGWDALRQDIFERQRESGLLPDGTTLTPRPEQLPAWDDYDDRYKPVASRLMEIYAGYLAHTDAQVGRLIDSLDELGILQNTLFIYVTGDNGASAEGGIHGVWSAPSFQNGLPEEPEWLRDHIDDFGTARSENHFNAGWAWALDSPFQWTKQVASHFGGTRNGMAISWPQGFVARDELRSQFHHVIDIVPTILDAAGIETPVEVNGVKQKPTEGVSMRYSFDGADEPSTRTTQYFEILGNRALYHEGWIASCFHGRVPWIRSQALPFGDRAEKWELYNIDDDFSQGVDLAERFPEKLTELRALFDAEARTYDVFPLSDETTMRALPHNRPSYIDGVTHFVFYPENVRMPELATVNLKNTSFDIVAHLDVGAGDAEGVIICQGGSMAGWSLYLRHRSLAYVYNYYGHVVTEVSAPLDGLSGEVSVGVSFDYDGGGLGKGGTARLVVSGRDVASTRIEHTVPFIFSMSGETLDVGIDTGSPVGAYPPEFGFTGTIHTVQIDLRAESAGDGDGDALADGQHRAAQRAQ